MSAQPNANLRVRISGDLADIKRDLALLKGALREVKTEAGKPLPKNNPIDAMGMSAGQTANALRQLPMQFTDIFVGLASGQKPMMVLLQQGGQLKDTFGGVGAAMKASLGYVVGLINPMTVAAAAVGALVLAWKQASDAQFEFDKAVIETGGFAGKTSDQLRELVSELDALDGVARGSAAKAVLEVAKSGRFAGEQFDLVAKAAARLESSTGQAVDTTVDKFREIAKDPVQALLKLNETEHFLTRAQLDRVAALKQEGNEQQAVAEALRIYASHTDDVASKSEAALPAMSRWWREIKDEIGGAWGELQEYMLLLDRAAQRQGQLQRPGGGFGGWATSTLLPASQLLPDWATNATLINALGKQFLGGPAGAAPGADAGAGGTAVRWAGIYSVVDSKEQEKRLKDREAFRAAELRYLDDAAKKKRELAEVDKLVTRGVINQEEATRRKQQIEDSYARKAAKRANADNSAAESLVATIQRQITANQQLAETGDKVSASDRLLIQARQLLADKTNTMTASTRALLESLLPQLEATDKAAEATQRQAKATEALARQQAILQQQAANRARSNELDLMGIGRGADATAQLRRRLEIDREYTDELKRLGDRAVAEDTATWDAMAAAARLHRDQQLQEESAYQAQRLGMLGDWQNGARAAWEDYVFQATNAAEQARGALQGAFARAEDAFVRFVQTGKLEFKDLANSIISDLARIQFQRAVVGGLGGWFDGLFGSSAGGAAQSILTKNALGGVYRSPDLSAYSNSIVNRPTFFAFAKGAGVMGEAGPEAIMPLRRTADGKLGVEAVGGRTAAPNIQITLKNEGQPIESAQIISQRWDGTNLMIEAVLNAVARDVRRRGVVGEAVEATYGVQGRGVARG